MCASSGFLGRDSPDSKSPLETGCSGLVASLVCASSGFLGRVFMGDMMRANEEQRVQALYGRIEEWTDERWEYQEEDERGQGNRKTLNRAEVYERGMILAC